MNVGLDIGMACGEKGVQSGALAAFSREDEALEHARAFLKSGREIDAGISTLLAQLDRARAWNARLPDGRNEEIEQYRSELMTQIERLKSTRREIAEVILKIREPEIRMVLSMRCLTYKTWPQIGIALSLDDSAAKRRYAKGEKLVAFVLSERETARAE